MIHDQILKFKRGTIGVLPSLGDITFMGEESASAIAISLGVRLSVSSFGALSFQKGE